MYKTVLLIISVSLKYVPEMRLEGLNYTSENSN